MSLHIQKGLIGNRGNYYLLWTSLKDLNVHVTPQNHRFLTQEAPKLSVYAAWLSNEYCNATIGGQQQLQFSLFDVHYT